MSDNTKKQSQNLQLDAVKQDAIRTEEALQELNSNIKKVKTAYEEYQNYTQKQVDAIVMAVAIAANKNRLVLAKMAVEETKMGEFESKVIKNHFASEFVHNKYKNTLTCGIIENNRLKGIEKVAAPMGIIAAITPVTNPTSTVIFKTLLALKTRNAIFFAPHPKAKKCSNETARILLEAAVAAGAPQNVIGWATESSLELTQALMKHEDVALILATGGPGLVKSAYSSGKPAIGVGAGNTPAIIDETADIPMAINSILLSKTFDNGTICASEQSIVAVESIYESVKQELKLRGAHLLSKEERDKLAHIMIVNGRLNPYIVGQPAQKIAKMAGISVPTTTRALVAEAQDVGPSEPFSYEKLSPILALYCEKDFFTAINKAEQLLEFGGLGHTSVLYTDEKNQDRIEHFGNVIKTIRLLVNVPASHGAIGDIYNFYLEPSLTLGCGTYGGNAISGNIGVENLLNIKTIAERRENMLLFKVPPAIYFKYGSLPVALQNLTGKKRAFIVTDRSIVELGHTDTIIETLKSIDMQTEIFSDIQPDPDFTTVKNGLERMQSFKPDVIISIGGGSPIDAAKIMWLLYDYPEINFEDLSMRFMDITKRIYSIAEAKNRTFFVAVPTTSGTGSEVTPFAVIADKGVKYPIADYALTPNMAILDPALVLNMPPNLTAASGFDAIIHSLEAIVAVTATDYTNALALESLRLLFKYLPTAYREGKNNYEARERVHYAATMAGMAFANAYLGICHSMAHKLGAAFNIPHGVANSLCIAQVINFNSSSNPTKLTAFPQYRIPLACARYAKVANLLQLGGKTDEEKVQLLIKKLKELKKQLNLPASIEELGITKKDFMEKVDALAELAFDDQCTGTNPRFPLVREIRELYIEAYDG